MVYLPENRKYGNRNKNMMHAENLIHKIILLALIPLFSSGLLNAQAENSKLYPLTYDYLPEIKSPTFFNDTLETLLVATKTNKYALVSETLLKLIECAEVIYLNTIWIISFQNSMFNVLQKTLSLIVNINLIIPCSNINKI